MFDMRYHIVSLVAVFLALAIGIVLGTVIVDKGILVDQQTALVERLEGDFERLRRDNASLTDDVRKSEQYIKQSFYPLIDEKLADQHVAVVFTSSVEARTKREIWESIRWAGATYSSVTLNIPFDFENEAFKEKVQPSLQDIPGASNEQRLLDKLAETYAAPPGDNKFLQDLSAAGCLSIDRLPAVQATSVLVIGGSDAENLAKDYDVVFIDKLKSLKLRTVGAETTMRKTSYMTAYQRMGVSTVDNIDERIGQVAAVLSLATGAIGNYGNKPTANQLIPVVTP